MGTRQETAVGCIKGSIITACNIHDKAITHSVCGLAVNYKLVHMITMPYITIHMICMVEGLICNIPSVNWNQQKLGNLSDLHAQPERDQ